MRRLAPLFTLVVIATVLIVACDESQMPTDSEAAPISLAISDGAHADPAQTTPSNRDFFFLPPIVPNPVGTENYDDDGFNVYLAPKGLICRLGDGVCVAEIGRFDLELVLDSTHYQYNWKTNDLDGVGLDYDTGYRINVYIGSPPNAVLLGYRDVFPVPTSQDVPNDSETLPFYIFRYGSTIPIKVRLENWVLCPEEQNCVTKYVDLATDSANLDLYDASNGLLSQLSVPSQGGNAGEVTLNMRPCAVDLSERIDIPTYGPCIEIDDYTDDGEPLLLTPEATIVICDLSDVDWPYDPTHQHDLVALHRWYGYEGDVPEADGQLGHVQALPLGGYCEVPPPTEPTGVMGYAKAGWSVVRDNLLSPVVPGQLHANPPAVLHRGMGGISPAFSRFQLALPSKMGIVSGDNQIAPAGSAVPDPLVVQVTDLKGNPVVGAKVTFDTSGAQSGDYLTPTDPLYTYSNDSGFVRVMQPFSSWVLGPTGGDYYVSASGRGIAVEGLDGPRSVFDPFATLQRHWYDDEDGDALLLADDGAVTFTATACETLYVVDEVLGGLVGPDATTRIFEANISGGSDASATLSIWNDCLNLYVNVTVPRDGDEKVNSLRIDLDDDARDGRTEGDDVVILDVDDGLATLSDMWLTESCVSKKQAGCGAADATADDKHKQAAFFIDDSDRVEWVYVVVIPLRNPQDLVHDLNATFGMEVGVSITLQMGNGAQGNTQVPAFGVYEYHTINP